LYCGGRRWVVLLVRPMTDAELAERDAWGREPLWAAPPDD
jgi:hypothetical protein